MHSTIFFFQRDYLQAICQDKVYRIKTTNSQVESLKLHDVVHTGGNCFLDAQYYYFLTKNEDEINMAIVGSDIIDTGFVQQSGTLNQNAIVGGEKDVNVANVKINYPKWGFNSSIKRLDYDEFNSVVNLLLSNFTVV